ncbi:MAG: hypothetical protein ABIZ34_01725, partial [Candidatus Limnocylindrales bacterium]
RHERAGSATFRVRRGIGFAWGGSSRGAARRVARLVAWGGRRAQDGAARCVGRVRGSVPKLGVTAEVAGDESGHRGIESSISVTVMSRGYPALWRW